MEPQADAIEGKPLSADDLKSLIGVVGDENTVAIINVAQDASKSADQKMREIYAIDSRYLGKTSPEWATLLRVKDSAIRQTDWWRLDRARLRGSLD
jgi:hypothetical protein